MEKIDDKTCNNALNHTKHPSIELLMWVFNDISIFDVCVFVSEKTRILSAVSQFRCPHIPLLTYYSTAS